MERIELEQAFWQAAKKITDESAQKKGMSKPPFINVYGQPVLREIFEQIEDQDAAAALALKNAVNTANLAHGHDQELVHGIWPHNPKRDRIVREYLQAVWKATPPPAKNRLPIYKLHPTPELKERYDQINVQDRKAARIIKLDIMTTNGLNGSGNKSLEQIEAGKGPWMPPF